MNETGSLAFIVSIALSTLRVSVPLIFAALGGLLSERSGVVNLALEGAMIVGALTAAVVTATLHSATAGWIAAMVAGAAFGAIYGLFAIRLRADQIVAGTAMNMLAAGIAPFVTKVLYDSTGSSPALALADRFQSAPLWLCLGLVVFVYWLMRSTTAGLWIAFAGEHPEALDAAGIRVNRVRYAGVIASGACAAMGGAALSIFLSSAFTRNMSAGRGYMALAALIFGKWRPLPTAAACLLFGFAEAMQIRLQGVTGPGGHAIPVQFIQILPYVITVLVLAGVIGRSRAPRALGQVFVGGSGGAP